MRQNETLADFINRLDTILDNAESSPEIAAALTTVGYDASRLATGRTLLDNLVALDTAQVQQYAKQYAMTAAVNAAYETADRTYSLHRSLAKRLFKDDPKARKQLLLNEHKAKRRARWLRQTRIFYENLLGDPELLAVMQTVGQTQAMLADNQEIVMRVAELDSDQQREKALAQTATQARDAAWESAYDWLNNLLDIAGYALAEKRQMKEAFLQIEAA